MGIKQILILIISILLFWGIFVEPNLISVKKITLKSKGIKNLRIAFVSDFHLSKFSKTRLNRIINKINSYNPDIVLSGGDYVIMHRADVSMDMEYAANQLSKVKTKYGVYSVMGNHDYFKDNKYIKSALTSHGIKVLENSNVKIDTDNGALYLAGISDMQTTIYDLDKALRGTTPPIILLSHSPDIAPLARNRVNLVLSGHTHGGQVRIPFFGAIVVPSKYGKRYETGFKENLIYISKGLGTSILRLRFNCPPEITIVDFK